MAYPTALNGPPASVRNHDADSHRRELHAASHRGFRASNRRGSEENTLIQDVVLPFACYAEIRRRHANPLEAGSFEDRLRG